MELKLYTTFTTEDKYNFYETCMSGDTKTFKFMLDNNFDAVKKLAHDNSFIFHTMPMLQGIFIGICSYKRCIEILKIFLQYPKLCNLVDNDAFKKAIGDSSIEVINLLIQDENMYKRLRTSHGFCGLCKSSHVEITKSILKYVDPSDRNNQAICDASAANNVEIIKLLLKDPRVDPSAQNNYVITEICRNNSVEIAKLLLQNPKVDPSTDDNMPIFVASVKGNTEIVRLLLQDPRVNPATLDNRALMTACRCGQVEVAKLLLQDPRVDPSDKNNEILTVCGDIKILKLILCDPRVDPKKRKYDILKKCRRFYLANSSDHVHTLCRLLNIIDLETCKTIIKWFFDYEHLVFLQEALPKFAVFRKAVFDVYPVSMVMCDHIKTVTDEINSDLMVLLCNSFSEKSMLPDDLLYIISTFLHDVSIGDCITFTKKIRSKEIIKNKKVKKSKKVKKLKKFKP